MRNSLIRWVICGVSVFFVSAALAETTPPSTQPAETVHISGSGVTPSDWSAERVQTEFVNEITQVDYTSHGKKHTCQCIPLMSLLKSAGFPAALKMDPKADPKMKSYSLRFVVVVRGREGYVVAYSLAELLPDVGNRHVWLALEEDGEPLPAGDAPMRLLAPDDAKPARGVHQLAEITLVDAAAASTQPDAAP